VRRHPRDANEDEDRQKNASDKDCQFPVFSSNTDHSISSERPEAHSRFKVRALRQPTSHFRIPICHH
jgi:hypothetical protein